MILATVTASDAMQAVVGGLAVNGTMLVIGAVPTLEVSPLFLLNGCRSVKGWYSGTSIDSQDTLAFSVLTGVRSMNEIYPLERAGEAFDRMASGKARFRVVLTTGSAKVVSRQCAGRGDCRHSPRVKPFFDPFSHLAELVEAVAAKKGG